MTHVVLCRRLLVHTLRDVLSSKLLPPLLETQPIPANLRRTDKCFACAWVSDQYAVVGSKCNKLLCVDAATLRMHDIPLPPKPARPQQLSASSSTQPGCGIHAMAVSPDGSMLAVGGADPSDCQVFHIQHHDGACPTFSPMQTLVGHQDWLFGVTWLTDRHLVTGSRDHSIKLWCNDEQHGATIYKPLESRLDHKTKVRDVKYCREILRLASLSADGTIKLWDPNLTCLQSIKLLQSKELVCMAMADNLVAVGSQSHVSLLDPRLAQPTVKVLNSVDPGQGVRSLGIMDHILSSGSGRGRIAFFDLRANDYISVQPEALSRPQSPIGFHHSSQIEESWQDSSGSESDGASLAIQDNWQLLAFQPSGHSFRRTMQRPSALDFAPLEPQTNSLGLRHSCWLQTGTGWLDHNHVYRDHFTGMQIWNACYAHAWDPTKTKLFSCGGPLAFGLIGSYMGLWN